MTEAEFHARRLKAKADAAMARWMARNQFYRAAVTKEDIRAAERIYNDARKPKQGKE